MAYLIQKNIILGIYVVQEAIPCIDFESASGKLQNYRHHERSCPKAPQMCLVPLPPGGYETPVSWPESKSKV